jgi:Putative metallopeptidase family (DUF6782)/N-terminal domain of anti-restriction factor ArdC
MSETTEQIRRRHEQREQIRAAVSELVNAEGFRRWLDVRSRFHRYSFGNCLLIAMQRPDATHVAGYKAWAAKFERQVRKGEKAIRILAPITVKRPDPATGDERYVCVGFRGACVFDIAQTDGPELPAPPECVPAEGDCLEAHRSALEGLARELGYVTYYYAPPSGALGFCDRVGRRIVVDPNLAPNAQVSVLVHELAHAQGIDYADYARAESETIVEATTMIVLGGLGFDTSAFSVPYIAGWAKDDQGLAALEKFAGAIDGCARRLEKALGLKS